MPLYLLYFRPKIGVGNLLAFTRELNAKKDDEALEEVDEFCKEEMADGIEPVVLISHAKVVKVW